MEPLWTPYRDVLMPSKSRAKRTLLGQGICSKGGGRLAQPIGNADALPSKEVGIHRPSAWSEQCQGGTEGSQQGTTPRISRLREGVPRARTGTSCRLACRQGQTRITGLRPGGPILAERESNSIVRYIAASNAFPFMTMLIMSGHPMEGSRGSEALNTLSPC
jgi:hypothetical protein